MSLFSLVSFRLEIFEELGSTNAFLFEQSHLENFHGRAILARRQLAGIGRRGRSWTSLEGNLALSLGLLLAKSDPVSLLPFLTGIVLFDTVQENLEKSAQLSLKWPNDIYLNQKKLGGMLSNAKQQGSEIRLVIGIGLNLAEAPTEARVPAISLSAVKETYPSADAFAAKFLSNLEKSLSRWQRPEEICREWENRCSHIGKEISYFSPDSMEKKQSVIAKSLLPSGELLVEEPGGARKNLSGEEVSLELLL